MIKALLNTILGEIKKIIENCFSFKCVPTLELDCHAIGDTSEKLY